MTSRSAGRRRAAAGEVDARSCAGCSSVLLGAVLPAHHRFYRESGAQPPRVSLRKAAGPPAAVGLSEAEQLADQLQNATPRSRARRRSVRRWLTLWSPPPYAREQEGIAA